MIWNMLAFICLPLQEPAAVQAEAPADEAGIAVVELFTSEGCSSCPPADRLLAQLAAERRQGVYLLSFHVDYWDYLGWRDPYAQDQFSRRQRSYAQTLSERVYTPQMVVNGTAVLVGSDRGNARRNIAEGLSRAARARVTLKILAAEKKNLDLSVSVTQEGDPRLVLQLAVVEDELSHPVTRGENRGRRLSHSKVVRHFETLSPRELNKGRLTLAVPPEVRWENAQIIAYVQEEPSLRIIGATALDLPATP